MRIASGVDENGEMKPGARLKLPLVIQTRFDSVVRDADGFDLAPRGIEGEQQPSIFIFGEVVVQPELLI